MTKPLLKKYTRIPEHLYVTRDADRQLKRIIEDMERPGYVLVARQMGKTNLLLNAKRTMEGADRLFLYVDLSNTYSTDLGWYRNIIDLFIETYEDTFGHLEMEISDFRKENRPPHNEYERSLRLLLKSFEGKIIIILDEIDTLSTAPYSSNIFSQIRSTYFTRTNFPELCRLTYVLSGVADPTNLIKDKTKSPFNIGNKVYLNDFTAEEHRNFIAKTKLDISEELVEEIYLWANGSPRITFDICSEIESHLSLQGSFSVSDLAGLIETTYLTQFDIPPIDHIRELVSKNPEAREAIVSIHSGECEISGSIKHTLYLYGVIGSVPVDEPLKLKNRIVARALSLDWLKSLGSQMVAKISLAEQHLDEGRYQECIDVCTEYEPAALEHERAILYHFIGLANYHQKNFKEAIKSFGLSTFNKHSVYHLYYHKKIFFALSYVGLGEINNGMDLFTQVSKEIDKGEWYVAALLGLGYCHTQIEEFTDHHYARSLLLKAIPAIDELLVLDLEPKFTDPQRVSELKAACYTLLSQSYEKEDPKKQLEYLDLVLSDCPKYYLPEVLFLKTLAQDTGSSKLDLTSLVSTIIDNELTFVEHQIINPIAYTKGHAWKYLLMLYNLGDTSNFEKLLNYIASNQYETSEGRHLILEALCQVSYRSKTSLHLFKKIINDISANEDIKCRTYRNLFFVDKEQDDAYLNKEYFEPYKELFIKTYDGEFNADDLLIFSNTIKYYVDNKMFDEGLKICALVEPYIELLPEPQKTEGVMFDYWATILYYIKKDSDKSILYADKVLQKISEITHTSVLDKKAIKHISSEARQIKAEIAACKPYVRVGRKYGRNDHVQVRYKTDDKVLKGKYKKFQADHIAGLCEIMPSER
ncbi:MAG: AAA-like domain-containing protein [Nitrosomonadaceae bacterium]